MRWILAVVLLGALAVSALFAKPHYLRYSRGYSDSRGINVVHYELDSRLLNRQLDEIALVPPGDGQRPLLVLLHGRNSRGPKSLLSDELLAALAQLGNRAPVVVLLNGAPSSYYHDRRDGRWGSMILTEAIPDAQRRFRAAPGRTSIGGISMGGFGALHLASRASPGSFCSVGAHSAALWHRGSETPQGAFDDAEDYARVDVWRAARNGRFDEQRVWIDVGRDDGFADANIDFANLLSNRGVSVEHHVWDGAHERAYTLRHVGAYLSFYERTLRECSLR